MKQIWLDDRRGAMVLSALLSIIILGLGSAGCQSTVSEVEAEPEAERATGLPTQLVPPAETLDESPLIVGEIAPERAAGQEEEFIFPTREAQEVPDYEDTAPFPEDLIKGVESPDEIVNVTFNFDATPLTEVVPLFGALLDFSYLVDPGVAGAVTMKLDTEMSARQVWRMFEHLLWLSGAYASHNQGFIHVLPFQKMPGERSLLTETEPQANVEVAILPIYHTKSAEIIQHLQPFLTQGATVSNLTRLNSLLIVEAPANMPKLRALLKELDSKGEAGWPHISLRCRNVDAEIIRQELETLLPILGLPVTGSSPSGGEIKLVAIPRLQAIVASAPLEEVLDEVKRWVRLLDREDAAEQENIYFYNVRHSTADQLAEMLQVFFGDSAAQTARRPSQTRAVSARAAEQEGRQPPPPARRTTASQSGNGNTPTVFDTPLIIYADGVQNRITIRTTRRAYAMIEMLLRRMDVSPRQVLIQGIIADIQLNDELEYGFSYAAMDKYQDYIVRHAFIGASGSFGDPRDIASGFAFRLNKNEDKIAFLRAVAGDSNVRVLSAPQIMATSDQEAKINIGDRVPVVTGDYTDLSAVQDARGTIRRNIEYTDTGVIMTVTPYITAGNQVRLDIVQEVSDAVETITSDIDSPTIRKRQLSTTLIIEDGGTALLGGLIRSHDEESYRGIPLLMDIPVLGHAFRSNRKGSRRTELLVLFTVNVIDSQDAVEQLVERYQKALKTIRENIDL